MTSESWSPIDSEVERQCNCNAKLLDIRIAGEAEDYILWNAVDIRAAFAHPNPPAAAHLAIAMLILEGAVHEIASGNWDGFIEAALARLSGGAANLIQVIVDPDHLRDAAGIGMTATEVAPLTNDAGTSASARPVEAKLTAVLQCRTLTRSGMCTSWRSSNASICAR